jgi:hypothetical protein
VDDGDRRVRDVDARVEGGDGRVVPAGDLPEEDTGEHWAGQVQPGASREVQVVGHVFATQGDGHLRDAASPGGGLLGGGHGHVGGAEIDLPSAERGDARTAAHDGIADGHAWMLLMVFGEGHSEEWRVERRPGAPQGRRMAVGAEANRCRRRAARGGRGRGARTEGEEDNRGGGCPNGALRCVVRLRAGSSVAP